jgi:DNA repair exonuclease SbcCD ATPase subunit
MHDLIDNLKLRQIIIVSHETKVESFVDQVLNVQKEEFISSIN